MLNDLLVKCLPKDTALTAVFNSCHSGTLLGDVPPIGISSLLSLIPRQTLYITSATVCITRRFPPTHSYVQQGGTRQWSVLRPRANPALGWEAAKVISHLPASSGPCRTRHPHWMRILTSAAEEGIRCQHRSATFNVMGCAAKGMGLSHRLTWCAGF